MKTNLRISSAPIPAWHRACRLVILPALTLSLVAQTAEPTIDHGAVLTWPVTEQEQILVSAPDDSGPWFPCLEPIARGPGYCQTAVRTEDAMRLYRLTAGLWYMNDFDDGSLAGWWHYCPDPLFDSVVGIDDPNGQIRILGTSGQSDRRLFLAETNRVIADFAVSIDLVDWSPDPTCRPSLALLARLQPSTVENPSAPEFYGAGVTLVDTDEPDKSLLWIWRVSETLPDQALAERKIPQLDRAKDYRLVFSGAGNLLRVQLFDLAEDGTLTSSTVPLPLEARDNTFTNGLAGFRVKEDPTGCDTLDITVDGFVATGTIQP